MGRRRIVAFLHWMMPEKILDKRRALTMASSVVFFADVTPHRFILIRAGIGIPGASL
jgi:hypothetical protein